MIPFLVEGFDFRHQRKSSPSLFLTKGLHFRSTPIPISNEGVAFSVAFQAKGLHFRPLVRGSGAFLAKGSHFLPQTHSHVSTYRIGQESHRNRCFQLKSLTHLTRRYHGGEVHFSRKGFRQGSLLVAPWGSGGSRRLATGGVTPFPRKGSHFRRTFR